MQIRSDDEIAHFKIGDVVRVVGALQLLKIVECRESMSHVYIEAAKRVHYKCEWRGRDGTVYTAWYEGSKLEKVW
jgi:hypothetical protein